LSELESGEEANPSREQLLKEAQGFLFYEKEHMIRVWAY